jgi:TolA-binding protein
MTRKWTAICLAIFVFAALAQAQSDRAEPAGSNVGNGNGRSEEINIAENVAAGEPRSSESQAAASQKTTEEQMLLLTNTLKEMKAQMAEQQRQIEQLNSALQEQKKLKAEAAEPVSPAPQTPRLGEVASASGMVPMPPAMPMAAPVFAPQETRNGDDSSPLQFHLGSAYFTPIGFMDMTAVSRSTNPGSGIGTNFGSVPFSNTQAGSLT